MASKFIDWLTKLAPEGETMLVLKQKPKRDEGGNVLLHPDPRATRARHQSQGPTGESAWGPSRRQGLG